MISRISSSHRLDVNKRMIRYIGWLLIQFCIQFCMIVSAKPPLQLANVYPEMPTEALVLSEYWVSEKLDGIRGYGFLTVR